jgi:hypothetical protein
MPALRFQPESELSQWYQERFGKGDERLRKIGIVALARKLLIALWRYVETGLLPEGAVIASSVHFRSEDPSRSARTKKEEDLRAWVRPARTRRLVPEWPAR